MRGKLKAYDADSLSERIIPAHAGQTSHTRIASPACSDHPRACGANISPPSMGRPHPGSSPRMRGKLVTDANNAVRVRIIPAHAGQTDRKPHNNSSSTDHPRACGANSASPLRVIFAIGSSPRMRGKRRQKSCHTTPRRIIPAHAGQTRGVWWHGFRHADHPRACGANPSFSVA